MAGILSAQLNATPGCIPSKWTRSTIADGDWLQAKTLNQYSTRDNWLAEKIEELSGKSDEDLEKEIQARIAGDTYLSGAISSISSDFYPFSANVEASAAELNTKIDNEITRATNKEGELNAKISNTNTRIDNLEAATDVIAVFGTYEEFTAASASTWQKTVTDNDFIKVIRDDNYQPNQNDPDYQTTDDDVYQVYYEYHKTYHDGWSGWSAIGSLDPYYSVSEIDDLKDQLSATIAKTYLSANGTDISAGKNLDVVIKSNNPRVAFKTKDNVTFDGVSSTTLSATTAYGSSAKFTNISASTVTALTATGNSAKFTTFSGTTYNGITYNGTTFNGTNFVGTTINNSNIDTLISKTNKSYDIVNSAKFSAVGSTTSTAYISGGFGIKAGNGVGVSLDGKNVVITAEGTTYNDGDYISTANKTISVTGNLIGSAESGQSAYDWITGQSATLSAGPGIQFNSAAEKTMGIYITAAGIGGVITAIAGSALSAGTNYTQGRCITIDAQNKINLSSDINLNSKLIIDHYNESDSETYATANLESFKLDFSGSREGGGSFNGHSATYNINQLMIDNYADNENLSFVKLDNEKLQLSASYKNGGYTITDYTNIAKDYFETQRAGSPSPYYLKFDGYSISAGRNSSNVTAAQWSSIVNAANGTWVSATSQEIVIDAPYQTRIVVTASVPGSLNANTYYII